MSLGGCAETALNLFRHLGKDLWWQNFRLLSVDLTRQLVYLSFTISFKTTKNHYLIGQNDVELK